MLFIHIEGEEQESISIKNDYSNAQEVQKVVETIKSLYFDNSNEETDKDNTSFTTGVITPYISQI